MTDDMKKAAGLLEKDRLTFAAVNGDDIITSSDRGVKPLLTLIDSSRTLSGYSAADRVVGNGAAYLYVLLRVKSVYTYVISKVALGTFAKYGIDVSYDTLTDAIRNRSGDGLCPMESAVAAAESPEAALGLIRNKLKELMGK
ncbi:DUF1893 domain-containing protein [Huintestinicola sp.]